MVMMLTISPHHRAMLGTWLCCIDFGQCAIACVLQSVHHECLVSSSYLVSCVHVDVHGDYTIKGG